MSDLTSDAHSHEHPKHDLSDHAKRIYAIRDLLIEKKILTEDEINRKLAQFESKWGEP